MDIGLDAQRVGLPFRRDDHVAPQPQPRHPPLLWNQLAVPLRRVLLHHSQCSGIRPKKLNFDKNLYSAGSFFASSKLRRRNFFFGSYLRDKFKTRGGILLGYPMPRKKIPNPKDLNSEISNSNPGILGNPKIPN